MNSQIKNLLRSFIVYSSMFINNIIFYLSNGTKETSDIISNLIYTRKPKINFSLLKQILLSENYTNFFQIFSAIPYWNILNLCYLFQRLNQNKKKLNEIAQIPIELLFPIINATFESNHGDFTLRFFNFFLKFLRMLKL